MVLLVESLERVAEAWRRCLRGVPGLVCRPSATEALDWLTRGGDAKVIISAQQLLDMDGVVFLRRALKLRPRAHGVLLMASERLLLDLGPLPGLTLVAVPPAKGALRSAVQWAALAGGVPQVVDDSSAGSID